MGKRLPSTLPVFSSSADINNMPPKKRPGMDSDATENVSWTDDEVELLLGVFRSSFSQNDYE